MNQHEALTVLQMHDLFGEETIEDLTAAVKVLAPVVDGREHNKTSAHPDALAEWVQAARADLDTAEQAAQEQAGAA